MELERDQILDYMEAQLASAEEVAEEWRITIDIYKKTKSNATKLVRPVKSTNQAKRQRVDYLINEAIDQMPVGKEFVADTIFENISKPNLDRDKTKISISFRLSQLEKEGKLRRISRGVYVK
jgi:hypothetical protein